MSSPQTVVALDFALIATLILVGASACSTDAGPADGPSLDAQPASSRTPPDRPDLEPLVKGPRSADGLQAILGTGDLGVGANRVGFVITSPRGIVGAPTARVTPHYVSAAGSESPGPAATAHFQKWPFGSRGMYVAEMAFDRSGQWGLEIEVDDMGTAELTIEVDERPLAPAVGSRPPASRSKTIGDVDSLAELTTGSLRDPDLYEVTLEESIASDRPTVVVFASPAFCTNAVCGPQLDVLQKLKDGYKGRANFVHVDFYDNPHEIQGDLDRARLSPTVREWRLPSIEWTFVIGSDGIVAARFEAFATFDEVELALLAVL